MYDKCVRVDKEYGRNSNSDLQLQAVNFMYKVKYELQLLNLGSNGNAEKFQRVFIRSMTRLEVLLLLIISNSQITVLRNYFTTFSFQNNDFKFLKRSIT